MSEADYSKRLFWCNGQQYFIRRSKVNPAMVERLNERISNGDLTHVKTEGDVEIYDVGPSCELYGKREGAEGDGFGTLMDDAVQAITDRRESDFVDCAIEIAYWIKSSGQPEQVYQNVMNVIEAKAEAIELHPDNPDGDPLIRTKVKTWLRDANVKAQTTRDVNIIH